MIWSDVQNNWPAHVPRALTRWPALDEDDVLATDGRRPEFAELVAGVTGLSPSEADAEVTDWIMGLEPSDTVMDPTRDSDRITASAADLPDGEDVYAEDGGFGDDDAAERPIGRNT